MLLRDALDELLDAIAVSEFQLSAPDRMSFIKILPQLVSLLGRLSSSGINGRFGVLLQNDAGQVVPDTFVGASYQNCERGFHYINLV
jgi:hypothetical protein